MVNFHQCYHHTCSWPAYVLYIFLYLCFHLLNFGCAGWFRMIHIGNTTVFTTYYVTNHTRCSFSCCLRVRTKSELCPVRSKHGHPVDQTVCSSMRKNRNSKLLCLSVSLCIRLGLPDWYTQRNRKKSDKKTFKTLRPLGNWFTWKLVLNWSVCVLVVGTELSTLRKENLKSMLVSVIILVLAVAGYLTYSSL